MGKKTNQEKTRKYGGSSSYVDASVPSKAPRQDESTKEFLGSAPPRHQVDDAERTQGISNRPANEEHAFPDDDAGVSRDESRASVESPPKQQGGNRGGV